MQAPDNVEDQGLFLTVSAHVEDLAKERICPFSKDISDAELWMPPSKQSLVEDLTDAMHARQRATPAPARPACSARFATR